MRSTLVRGAMAISSMIAIAFGLPTALVVRQVAQDPSQVTRAWWTLAVIAVLLIAGSALAADRLGVRTMRRHRAAMDAEREVAADLSHRLRTPLTALRLDADALPPGAVANRMRDAIEALDAEIDAIILSARSPGEQRAAEQTDLVDVVADRLAFWAVLAEDHGREWTVLGGEDPIWVPAPRADAIAAVDALLGNVFQHTPQGAPFRVTMTRTTLTVEDGGPGIKDVAAALQRGSSSDGSTGLGLDIVARIARHSGGAVQVDRSDLGGARVTMQLGALRRAGAR